MFKELLGVKKIKEQGAAAAVGRAKDVVREREAAVTEAKRKVEEYRAWRLKEEVRIFERIKGAPVKIEKIDEMKFEIVALRERETVLEAEVGHAEEAVKAAEAALAEAEAEHRLAEKAVQKYEQLVADEREAAAKAATIAEDAEIEEVSEAIFAVRRLGTKS